MHRQPRWKSAIGLRTITYTVGWYNIEDGESISWRAAEAESHMFKYSTAPGQYNFTYFRNLVRRLGINISLSVDRQQRLNFASSTTWMAG